MSVTHVLAAEVDEIWAVIHDTSRYADWVAGVLEVTRHHGPASVGATYSEINRTLGPLTTRLEWTVREVVPHERRVDTGTGFAPLRDLENVFVLEPLGEGGTRMTYEASFRVGLGPARRLLAAVLRRTLAIDFALSMRRLDDVVISERDLPAGPAGAVATTETPA